MTTAKANLFDYDRKGLRDLFARLGEKPYRADQVMKWVYHRHVTDFAQMSDVGKALRDKLTDAIEILPPNILFEKQATHSDIHVSSGPALHDKMERAERDVILEALRAANGSRREVAEKLGISPRTLRYKLARIRNAGIEVPAA